MNESPKYQPGLTLSGKYQLKRKLGEGAFGEVWLSDDLVSRADVVLKMLHAQWSRVPAVVERFRREALASQRIQHPSACRVFEFAMTDDGTPYITMEYLSGGTLKNELQKSTRLPLARVAKWMVPVCEAVEAAHKAGIVHRDLKPENIMMKMVGGEEVPVVLDFGIAKLLDAEQKLTQTGSILGSPAYMSPEQSMGQSDIGPPADLYSLAIIVFELVSGAPPFVSKSFAEMAVKHAHDPAPPLTGVPPQLAQVVARCLGKQPAQRPPVAELARALRAAASSEQAVRTAERSRPAAAPPGTPVRASEADRHSAQTMISEGGSREFEEAMRRLKEPAAAAAKGQAQGRISPAIIAGVVIGLATLGVLIGWLIR